MTPEVRDRIDQIRHGNVPEGYKKTESGIIPNEWRVGQVSECIEEYKLLSNDIAHIPVYSSSRKGLIPQSDYYEQKEAVETNLGYKVVPQGYVTYRHMSDDDVFHFNINRTGGDILVSSEYPVFTSSDNCDLSFLIPALNNTARFRYFCKIQKLGGTRTRLYLDNLKKYALALPPFSEQIKIAEILATQDKVIELEQQKIEEIKKEKKFFLSKMFPKKGQAVPEIRFKGFTDAWEQRKVSELFRVTRGYVLAATQTETVKTDQKPYPVYSSQTKDKGLMGYYKDYLYEDAITWTTDGANAGTVNYRAGKFYCTNVCGVLLSNEVKANQMIAEALNNVAKGYVSYVGNPKLMNNVMADIVIQIPTQAEEREQLSSFFTNLDNLITLHQRKLEEEKQKKKALMQLLLMGIVRV